MASPALTGYLRGSTPKFSPARTTWCLQCAPLVPESINALALEQQQAVLIEMDLLHRQELSGLKRHDMHVEVVLGRRGKQLAQPENFTIARKQWLRIRAADLHLRAAG